MPLNPLGVLDLSHITDRLVHMIEHCRDNSPLWATLNSTTPTFTITVSGSAPESVRKDGGCQVTVSLIHISQDKFQRNFVYPPSPQPPPLHPPPPRAQEIPTQPLALDLYYLISAYADKNYVEEQQAMSIVLRCFHEHPIFRAKAKIPVPPTETVSEEFTLTMEIETSDEMSRLWQSITAPYRLSVIYKVSVVFITPPAPPIGAKQVSRFSLAIDSTAFPFAPTGQVFGTSSSASFTSPNTGEALSFDYSPATVTPGARFLLYGAGLNQSTSSRVYLLLPPDYKAEQEVTSIWKAHPAPPDPVQTESRMVLNLPPSIGALPAGSPPPGVYMLRAGSDAPADPAANRTNATPFSIAARVEVNVVSPNPPLLVAVGGTYAVQGVGFESGSTEVLLETIPLTPSGVLAPGTFTVTPTQIQFQAPSPIAPGVYGVRIRVNEVESPPSWWIKVP